MEWKTVQAEPLAGEGWGGTLSNPMVSDSKEPQRRARGLCHRMEGKVDEVVG